MPNWSAVGLHHAEGYCFTLSEPYGARKWIPCYDLPFDKVKTTTEVIVPSGFIAVSNGELQEVIPSVDEDTYIWREDDPIATYLISLACGPYVELTDFTSDSIPLHYYVFPEDTTIALYEFENTPDMLEFFSQKFGPYPFQMYGMAEALLFNGNGAMEHQTVTTYGMNLIRGDRKYEYVVSHELAHMWWGDCLSPLTFAEIWLNEGFAVYSEALYIEARYDTLREHLANNADSYFWEDQNLLRYPLYDPPEGYLFGAAIYCKGAWVLHMLRCIIGDSAFFAGLQNYHAAYAYGNVTTPEFQAEMESACGQPLDWYFQQWVYEAGFPQYDYNYNVAQIGNEYIIDFYLEQVQTEAPVFNMPVELLFTAASEDTLLTVWNDQQYQPYQFTFDFPPTGCAFDPEAKILKWDMTADVETKWNTRPLDFTLHQNYPNPFNPTTTIPFSIPTESRVKIEVFNILGQRVAVLGEGIYQAGSHKIFWDGKSSSGCYLASGVYLLKMEAEGTVKDMKFTGTNKLLLLK